MGSSKCLTSGGGVYQTAIINTINLKNYEKWPNLRTSIDLASSVKLDINKMCGFISIEGTEGWQLNASLVNRNESSFLKSIQIAYKFAKKFVKTIDPSNNVLEENVIFYLAQISTMGSWTRLEDVSLGPARGPSAGPIYASILVSYALQKPIYQNLAMTGLISVEGKIGKIGAIYGKVIGSVKAGLKTVIVPRENQKDYEALPSEIKEKIEVCYAETFDDIYKVAFEHKEVFSNASQLKSTQSKEYSIGHKKNYNKLLKKCQKTQCSDVFHLFCVGI